MRINSAFVLTAATVPREDDCACPDRAFVLAFDGSTADLDSDCACPDKAFHLNCAVDEAPLFSHAADTHTTQLPNGFVLAYSPYAPGGPSVLSPAAWQRWQAFANPKALEEVVDQALAEQMLIHPYGRSPRPTPAKPETLTTWLHVTNACNLDCPYCYVRKSSERMSEAVGLRAVGSIFYTAQQQGFRRVKLKYAGGEATLHFKLVRRLHEHALQLAAETGIALKEVILSNGVHIRAEDAEWLAANQIKLMISIDGIGELHNQLRPLKNHTAFDTFGRVEHTIDHILLPRGIRPDVTMTVTALNAHGAAAVARWALIDRDLPTSFNFYRQNTLSASRQELDIEQQAFIDGMLAAYAMIEQHLPARPFLNGLLDRVQAEAHSHTCGVGQSYVVITHTGKLAQCQMHLDQPVQEHLNGDLLPIVAAGPLRNLSVDQKVGCRDCSFRYRCSGGCPLETYRATGRWDIQSPNCQIYKTLMPAAFRLEGLRLMKVHGYLS